MSASIRYSGIQISPLLALGLPAHHCEANAVWNFIWIDLGWRRKWRIVYFVADSATDDADEVFSTFPGNSERLVEFEASNEPHLPSYNLPVYGEDHCITG